MAPAAAGTARSRGGRAAAGVFHHLWPRDAVILEHRPGAPDQRRGIDLGHTAENRAPPTGGARSSVVNPANALEHRPQIDRRTLADRIEVPRDPGRGGLAPDIAQMGQELPFGIEL